MRTPARHGWAGLSPFLLGTSASWHPTSQDLRVGALHAGDDVNTAACGGVHNRGPPWPQRRAPDLSRDAEAANSMCKF